MLVFDALVIDFVLLMSHIQSIKGECDNILNITKNNKFSNIDFK